MTPSAGRSTVLALILCAALPAWGEQYLLYSPKPVAPDSRQAAHDGVLVQEIEVQKGDTLYGISRKFSGRGMYFPQILLFNSISDPNLIYPGKTLKIPVTRQESASADETTKPAAAAPRQKESKASGKAPAKPALAATAPSVAAPTTELSLSDLKNSGGAKQKNTRKSASAALKKKHSAAPAASAEKTPSSPLQTAHKEPAASVEVVSGQKLFEAGVKAYRQDDCRSAIDLLDRYLADNAASPLAADAALYKAECYLKLSAQ